MKLFYHTDEGCRKGCHPVSIEYAYRGKPHHQHVFSIDEPGAWWEDQWNCHVDGCDYHCESREAAIARGAEYHGYEGYEVVEAGAYHYANPYVKSKKRA